MTAGVVDEFAWLESWYRSRCDGRWEQERGVRIDTCDNPGWWVHIDIDKELCAPRVDVVLEIIGEPPSDANGNVGGRDWMLCQIKNGKFDGAGDPTKLRRIIACFRGKVAQPLEPHLR